MCNICNKPPYIKCDCITSQFPVNCDPCLKNKYCKEKIDADCVYYHLNDPTEVSKLTCLGLPSNTPLTIILEKIDEMLCGFVGTFNIVGEDTNSIDTTVTSVGNIYTVKSDLRIDPTSTAPISITADGLKVDCCEKDCTGVSINLGFLFTSLSKETDFFTTLDPIYFTKSDFLISLNLADTSTLTGDTITYLKYTLMPTGIDIKTATGSPISLGINNCGKNIINSTFPLVIELQTSQGCYGFKMCEVNTNKVDYSERFNYPYRVNFQINDIPIIPDNTTSTTSDRGILYFNDVKAANLGTSFGSVIRKINLNTREVRTISGVITGGAGVVTVNAAPGNLVGYDYISGPILDKEEISNGEPAIYAAVFGPNGKSCIVRIIKEKDNECDERANWTTYVISGSTAALGDVPLAVGATSNALAARYNQLYGIKRWFDINGEPSFLAVDAGNAKIKLLYYGGSGSKNDGNNWLVNYFGLLISSGVDRNINVDDIFGGKKLIILTSGNIKFYDFTVPTPSLTDIKTLANYVLVDTIGNGTPSDVDGAVPGVARVSEPVFISKYTDFGSSDPYWIWGNGGPGIPVPDTTRSRLRYAQAPSPTSVASHIGANTLDFGTAGLVASDVSGFSQGFFYDLQNDLYDLTFGGFRKWNLSTPPYDCEVFAGGFDGSATQTEWSGLNQAYMDTQYEFEITC